MKALISALTLLVLTGFTQGAVKPGKKATKFPEIWEKAGPAERLKAIRAAELDATRLLTERIYGLKLNGNTTVNDLALESDEVHGAVQATIRGVVTTEDPEYLEDGTVQVVRAVTLRKIVETISRTTSGKKYANGTVEIDSSITTKVLKTKDQVIDVMGNAALPDSPGHRKVLAKRAAEIDAYRRLAERIMGVMINSTSTVRDFVVADDRVLASMAASLKAAEPTEINFFNDDSCEVTMELTMDEVIRSVTRHSDTEQKTLSIDQKTRKSVYSETGTGAPRSVEKKASSTQVVSPGGVYRETEVILRQVVASDVLVK